jgi:hypothetical protein
MKQLLEVGSFLRSLRARMRFGELSRAPLRLLRLQLQAETAECDWMARPPDPWDADLPARVSKRNASFQALQDAIAVRDLLFCTLPDLSSALVRVYRESAGELAELIITGTISREERVPLSVSSLAMHAKLSGFRFRMDDGILEAMQVESLESPEVSWK